MKNIKYLYFLLFVIFAASCNKEEPVSATYQNLIGIWEPSSLSIGASIGNKSFVQYLVDDLGISQGRADSLAQDLVNIIAVGLTGTIEYKTDGTYDAVLGGDSEAGTWQLINSDQVLVMTENGSTESQELEIKTISSSTLVLEFDDIFIIVADGTEIDVAINHELTLDKQV